MLRRIVGATIAILLVALVSCSTSSDAGRDTGPGGPKVEGTEGQLLIADVDRVQPEGADVPTLVDGVTRFGLELFDQVAEPDANVVLSPASIAFAFAMARAGAAGTTAEEIDAVLHFPTDADTTHASFNALARLLDEAAPEELPTPDPDAERAPGEEKPPALEIANGVFPQVRFPIHEAYLDTLAAQYGAGVIPVDFTSDRAIGVINDWVDERTRGRIDELFASLPPETRLVLANAVYLKADWLHPFVGSGETEDAPFTLAGGSEVTVPTMQQLGTLSYAEGEGWQAVELPYVGERLAMWVIVPSAGAAPTEVLTPDTLAAVADGLSEGTVEVHLPRWDFATEVELIPVLSALGMRAPFGAGADFSGISDAGFWIGDAIHKANITVDEWGTEAAAVTGLAFATSGPPQPDAVIRADHPFAFAIVDTQEHVPLFLGQVADPSST